ncbi:hypothetical protein EST38_g13468 [Candolleomyces aberdarensis]|uniref:Helicase C-terminal domain-containing protein n=1 Tax=Candolleomyces aberdarensis TaxID=2316362 RepID=A0A4Q2CZW3_9AGAR|nr:hypothetical protein EST38_g13468 [Candolleomyces aberdarensis]
MKSSTTSFSFSELDWVLNEPDTTVIFCKTIALGFRVTVHLWHLAISKGLIDVAKRIRMFNSLNSAAFNIDTLQFVDEPGSPSVVIATDVLSVGWDGQLTRNAVIFGEPDNIDDFVQKIGRVGRNRTLVTSPRGILYHSKQALSTAKSVMEQSSRGTKDTQVMDPSMARFLLAKCKRSNIDEQYNDPTGDKPCGCTSCLARRTPDDGMGTCNCSGCMPETTFQFVEETFNGPEAKQRARPGEGISKNMRTHGTGVLESLRYEIYWTSIHGSFDTPYIYLPSSLITKLIDSIYSIDSVSDVKNIVSGHQRLEGHHQRLYDACEDLRKDFAGIRALEKRERLAKKAAGTAEAVLGSNSAHNGGGIIVNSEEGNGEELTLNPVSQTGIK